MEYTHVRFSGKGATSAKVLSTEPEETFSRGAGGGVRVGVAVTEPSRLEKQLVRQPSVKAAKPLGFKRVQK